MEIEVVEFYPFFRDDKLKRLGGTLHVYLVDLDMDIRGILVKKQGKHWFFQNPHAKGICPDTKETVRYPIITFTDNTKNRSLMDSIRKEGRKYIEEEYLSKPGDQFGKVYPKHRKKKLVNKVKDG